MGQVLNRQAGDGPDPELVTFSKKTQLRDGLDGALALTHHYRPSIKNFRLKSMV